MSWSQAPSCTAAQSSCPILCGQCGTRSPPQGRQPAREETERGRGSETVESLVTMEGQLVIQSMI